MHHLGWVEILEGSFGDLSVTQSMTAKITHLPERGWCKKVMHFGIIDL